LGRGYEVNESGSKEYEEVIQQETKKSSRIEGWRQHVVATTYYNNK